MILHHTPCFISRVYLCITVKNVRSIHQNQIKSINGVRTYMTLRRNDINNRTMDTLEGVNANADPKICVNCNIYLFI